MFIFHNLFSWQFSTENVFGKIIFHKPRERGLILEIHYTSTDLIQQWATLFTKQFRKIVMKSNFLEPPPNRASLMLSKKISTQMNKCYDKCLPSVFKIFLISVSENTSKNKENNSTTNSQRLSTWTKQSWKWSLSKPAAMVGSLLKCASTADLIMSSAFGQEEK